MANINIYISIFAILLFSCTRKVVTTSSDKTKTVTISKREIPEFGFDITPLEPLVFTRVVNKTDTVKVFQRITITKTDTLREIIVDCPDMVDTVTVEREVITNTVQIKKTFFGKIWTFLKDGFWWIILVATVIVIWIIVSKFN